VAATGTNVPLVITNSMPKATVITLTGPSSLTVNVQPGQTLKKSIPKATYKSTYAGCTGKKMNYNLPPPLQLEK
jgi:hypothetical protein